MLSKYQLWNSTWETSFSSKEINVLSGRPTHAGFIDA